MNPVVRLRVLDSLVWLEEIRISAGIFGLRNNAAPYTGAWLAL